jgi:hypothetical protein
MRRFFIACVASAAMVAVGAPAFAHHAANAQFDLNKSIVVEATLDEVEDINPHSYWHFTTADGTKWSFEGASPAGLKRYGVKPKSDIVKGGKFTVYAAPARNGSNNGLLQGFILPDGRKIMMRMEMPDEEKKAEKTASN